MGGRGDSSSISRSKGKKRGLSFGGSGKGTPSLSLFPSKINRRSATGNTDKMISLFKKVHEGAPREYGALLDKNGYATGYYEGASGSVSFPDGSVKKRHVVHNHPRGGWANFSGQDLVMMARSGATGITAVSKAYKPRSNASDSYKKAYANRRAGTYTVTKTHHFNADAFERALKNVRVRDDNYDKDLHKWLVRNQKRFGYKYSYKR